MTRVKRGNVAHKRRLRFIDFAKGFRGLASVASIFAMEQFIQSFNFSYIGRKLKKRNFRRICLIRLSYSLKQRKKHYSVFFGSLKKIKTFLNSNMLTLLV